jgi:hypothetical protein
MTMKEGIKKVASKAIDSKDEICDTLMKGGMEFKEASIAATILAKANLEQIINKVIGTDSDSGAIAITHGLSETGQGRRSLDS